MPKRACPTLPGSSQFPLIVPANVLIAQTAGVLTNPDLVRVYASAGCGWVSAGLRRSRGAN